jgi:hypothetical protein
MVLQAILTLGRITSGGCARVLSYNGPSTQGLPETSGDFAINCKSWLLGISLSRSLGMSNGVLKPGVRSSDSSSRKNRVTTSFRPVCGVALDQFASISPWRSLLAVSGCPVAFSICLFAAFVSALFRCSIPPLSLEMIDTCFRVDPYDRIVRAMLLRLLLRVEVRGRSYIGWAEA